ncbi:FAD-dependent oxidoreductase [Actinospica robiniae]|uniref:FAD-dependent oxidoreductase n=1 Tax=Actinospica robiniae TaxID=304901 RepID=UPI00146FA6D6|nr:FAD-dependent monooxygenase [Actinospica robiniae]
MPITDGNANPADVSGARRRWGKAVVIGGGFAGLVTARVLTDFFVEVVILEQDELDENAGVHPDVPQGKHAHGMLARGGQILERLFPGLRAELEAAGAPVFDYGEYVHFLLPEGYAPRVHTGVPLQTFTRDELERVIRRRVRALPQITLVDGVRCLGLAAKADGHVTGVLHSLDDVVDAEFVVDASGRSSVLTEWLARLHVEVPPKRVVKARVSYTSVGFERSDRDEVDFTLAYQMTIAPDVARGGVVLAVENDRWLCSLVGYEENVPPVDDEGYLQFARGLDNTHLFKLLEHRRGQDGVRRYTHLNNEWRQFHRVRAWPERLVAVGDAVCVLNPVFGQGMTMSAVHAELLHEMLAARAEAGGGLDGLGRSFQARLVRAIRPAWTLSSGSDLMWDSRHRPPASARVAHWYNRRLLAAAVREPEIWIRFVRVVNMIAPPATLFAPGVLAKVFARTG